MTAKEIDRDRLVETLRSLVRIPSFENSLKVSAWVKKEMEGIGYHVDSDKDGNLIAEIGKGPGFLLNAHLDTVAPGDGWRHGPFSGAVDNGRVYGRGSTDCKSGVASMIEIARILKNRKLNKRVSFTFTAFEEGHPLEKNGVYSILARLKDIEKGLVLEPTMDGKTAGIAVGCRGSAHYGVEIIGQRGHSSTPEKFDNPIYRFPSLLEGVRNFERRKMRIPLSNETIEDTMTVTEVWAKEGTNVIPSRCSVSIDRRSLPDEPPERIHERVREMCRKALGEKFSLTGRRAIQGYYYEDRQLLDFCREAASSAGMDPRVYFKLARTDSCVLYNFAKIGTYIMGPGHLSQAHTIDEYCVIDELLMATRAVLDVIMSWDESG